MDFLKKNSGLFILLILSFWVVKALFIPGFFPMHDDTQVVRVFEMGQALRDGHFPVRWTPDLGYGYGYPLFNFYAPLPYYFGGLLNLLGIDALISTKIMMAIGILLSGLFMYLLAREFWGELGGIISGIFYLYVPYHAVDIYVRGAVGEFWAYAFLPLMAWGFYKVIVNQRWRWVVIGAVGYAGVILSHNLTAMMVTPFLILALLLYYFIIFRNHKLSAIHYTLYAFLLGLGVSAFYWLPALSEIKYTNIFSQIGGGADFRDHFVCWQQLWDSPWGFGGSAPGCLDGMSFKIGKLHILTSLFALVIGFYLWRKDKLRSTIILFSFFYLLFSTAMTLEISKPIWEAIPLLNFIQYPWRFLIFISFFSSLLAGASFWAWRFYFKTLPDSSGLIIVIALIAVFLFFNNKLFQPQTILDKSSNDYTSEKNIKWTTSKISDEYLPREFMKPEKKEDIVKERVKGVVLLINKTQELSFTTDNNRDREILISIASFPSWRAFIDNISIEYTLRNNGIEIPLPKGKHEVRLIFVSTPIEKLANIITVISFLSLIGGILYLRLRL